MPYFFIEYFDDYEDSKSLEENDINIIFTPRERYFTNDKN